MKGTVDYEWLAQQEYLGRGILLGQTLDKQPFVAYFVTGRSVPSQARRFDFKNDNLRERISTSPTNPEELKKGNPALLVYDAVRRWRDFVVVSNGSQTDWVADILMDMEPNILNGECSLAGVMTSAFAKPHGIGGIDVTKFEPDNPNYTNRISGILSQDSGAIALCRPGDNSSHCERQFFDFPLVPGHAKFISTYEGRNVPKGEPIPRFMGEPLDFYMPHVTLHSIAGRLYDSLGPKHGEGYVSPGEDFRVGVVAAFCPPQVASKFSYSIINRVNSEKK